MFFKRVLSTWSLLVVAKVTKIYRVTYVLKNRLHSCFELIIIIHSTFHVILYADKIKPETYQNINLTSSFHSLEIICFLLESTKWLVDCFVILHNAVTSDVDDNTHCMSQDIVSLMVSPEQCCPLYSTRCHSVAFWNIPWPQNDTRYLLLYVYCEM